VYTITTKRYHIIHSKGVISNVHIKISRDRFDRLDLPLVYLAISGQCRYYRNPSNQEHFAFPRPFPWKNNKSNIHINLIIYIYIERERENKNRKNYIFIRPQATSSIFEDIRSASLELLTIRKNFCNDSFKSIYIHTYKYIILHIRVYTWMSDYL